ncbi:unnamed protein product, partial [Ilex paraguariensis]
GRHFCVYALLRSYVDGLALVMGVFLPGSPQLCFQHLIFLPKCLFFEGPTPSEGYPVAHVGSHPMDSLSVNWLAVDR